MMKFIFYLFCLFLGINAFSQQRHIHGHVTDKQGIDIPFVIVQEKGMDKGAYCDEHGKFSVDVDPDSATALIISCMGYERKEIALDSIHSDPLNIILDDKSIQLREANISTKKLKQKTGIIGKKGLQEDDICIGRYGHEEAIYLEGNSSRRGYIKEIFVYVTNDGAPSTKFRVHVYNVDDSDLPGRDITDSNLITHANTGNEWVKIDVSSKHIPIKGGVFISIEWIPGLGNDPSLHTTSKYGPDFKFSGQVIGYTNGYWKRGSLIYNRDVLRGTKWHYFEMMHFEKTNVPNLMIYATYTYRK